MTSLLTAYDYDRPIVAFHGTSAANAEALINGEPFRASTRKDEWLGHGIYFWEYAPQQAWWWAERRKKTNEQTAVVGALIRLGQCLDFLDPENIQLLTTAHQELLLSFAAAGEPPPDNANNRKYLDCAVFEFLYTQLGANGYKIDSARAVFVPSTNRVWPRSSIYKEAHIQICVREPKNILAVWPVRKDGRHGRDWWKSIFLGQVRSGKDTHRKGHGCSSKVGGNR